MTNAPHLAGLSSIQRQMMNRFYADAAGDFGALPWHRDEPCELLTEHVSNGGPLRALDIGCGSGIFSQLMARHGHDVTALDYHPEAVAMAHNLADAGPTFAVIQADILEYSPDRPFDLVYDSGCLHNFNRIGVERYAQAISQWLAPGGDFILEHWGKKHPFDWRPIGPYRRSIKAIERIFSPGLELVAADSVIFDVPFPLGPKVCGNSFQFHMD